MFKELKETPLNGDVYLDPCGYLWIYYEKEFIKINYKCDLNPNQFIKFAHIEGVFVKW